MEEEKFLNKLVSIIPNERQKVVQEMGFYAFIHFTINTFTGKEWGNGKENPKIFNPMNLDTDQWCQVIKSAGMKGVVLTAKHHDGFCLWQTQTTEHSVKNSGYKEGKGDVVKELSESCKKHGLKMGIYLSPWDRNSEYYGTDKYMDFYIAQLTELLSNYGDIFMLWLDGACGSHLDGKPCQKYDFQRIYDTALSLQPNIVMSGCAPDVRWVGNESGIARESEWNVVPLFNYADQNITPEAQKDDNAKIFQKRCVDVMIKDMGSREFLSKYDTFMWYPAEVDVSIRPGWFYHPLETIFIKSIKKLMRIYYDSVGGNSLLLLNIPPNRKGLLCKKDVKRLREMGKRIEMIEFSRIHNVKYESDITGKEEFKISNIYEGKAFSPIETRDKYNLFAQFEKTVVDKVILKEDTDFSQRVEKFSIYAETGNGEKEVYKGTVMGFNKIALFKPIETSKIRLEINSCRFEPYINSFQIIRKH